MKKIIAIVLLSGLVASCKTKKDPDPQPATTSTTGTAITCPPASCVYPDTAWTATGSGPRLVLKFKFDSTQVRLNNFGQVSTIPSGNAACSPRLNTMASHYIELAQNDMTALGAGVILYHAPETNCDNGHNAITFCQSVVVREGVPFFSIPLSQVAAGTYKWLRVSLSYENYDIPYKTNSLPSTQWGTVASFVGFNTYVPKVKIKTQDWVPSSSVGGPNANHAQGYWAFETNVLGNYYMADGQPPAGSTTVVNPLFATSPIPAGSCVVTAQFVNSSMTNAPLVITGNETQDVVVTVSLSTNKSFEWHEVNADGYYQPDAGEFPVDMGIRGMIPIVQ